MTVTVQPTPAENDSGLVYTAKATLAGSTYPGDTVSLGPTSLFVNLTVSNPTSAQRDVWLAGCAAWERIYVTANLSGTPLMDRARSTVCQPTYQHVVLGPGASQEIGISGAGVGAGSDTLTTGRYYVAVVVDRIHDLLTVPAGAVDFVSPLYGLTFAATTSVSGGNLVVHATMTDTTARPIRLEYGACAVQLLAYRTADRTGRPVWNSAYRAPYGISNSGYGCPAYLAVGTIKPGQTLSPPELNPSFRIIDMLADSLPNGHYYFNAAISMNWRDRIVSAGEADVSR